MIWYIVCFVAGGIVGGIIGAILICCCISSAGTDRRNHEREK